MDNNQSKLKNPIVRLNLDKESRLLPSLKEKQDLKNKFSNSNLNQFFHIIKDVFENKKCLTFCRAALTNFSRKNL